MADYGGLRPHLQGFGSGALLSDPILGSPNVGGRGGTIYRINTTADNNTAPSAVGDGTFRCSLRRALATETGARIVVFETSGVFTLTSAIVITNPYITVAGQSAPAPGISIRGFQVRVETHDVFLQHLRFRSEDGFGTAGNSDSFVLEIGGPSQWTYNVCVDHCSVAFAYGYMSIAIADATATQPNPWDVGIYDSLIAWPLSTGLNPTGFDLTGYGMRSWATGGGGITLARNLLVHSSHRNCSSQSGFIQWVNNLVYGSGPDDDSTTFSFQGVDTPSDTDPTYAVLGVAQNNWFVPSYDTGTGGATGTSGTDVGHHTFSLFFIDDNVNVRGDSLWLDGNEGPFITGPTGDDQWDGIGFQTGEGSGTYSRAQLGYASEPTWHSDMNFEVMEVADLEDYMVSSVGARPTDRDVVDTLAVAHMQSGIAQETATMGSRIVLETDLGLSLTLATNTQAFTVPTSPHTVVDAFGRTRIEETLEQMARDLEANEVPAATGGGGARFGGAADGLMVGMVG